MTNRTDCNAKRILSIYLLRWPIETVYQDGKQRLALMNIACELPTPFKTLVSGLRGLFSLAP
ncbi:hypothetical protein KFU94_05870 [Chloroflexi bacterium TSY]|nr:hypothetical protein [Chloroflexi bacterium TSY]